MSSTEAKKKLVGPWQSLHGVIWLIGLYILFTRGSFFPGILILIAVSALYEAFLRHYVPGAFVVEKATEPAPGDQVMAPPPAANTTPLATMAATQEHPTELLPGICPSCGGPVLGHEVKWTGAKSASCPYCGTNLPMNKS
jgi:hypothetical protein